ncbi:gamma-irradiation and mitomycin c induced 1 [Tasmannia lanceolata]|uniref:gamma-irradiation and mitomycin c induced 1 n=1 Tax=Tasmannia lanceolata TaxID=3420 RepID=UPI00406475A8
MAYRNPRKRPFVECLDEDLEKVYKFRILLPNGATTGLILREPGEGMSLDEFIHAVREEFERTAKRTSGSKRKIMWDGNVYLEDLSENKIRKRISFNHFKTNELHILRLHDGGKETTGTFQNMWDLTPHTDLLSELPAEYTFETSLADLIDNSLQAVWFNGPDERRLVSVTIDEHGISIIDTGPGMDGTDKKSIVKWGKIGSSNHRSSRGLAVGGKPPYLMPFFGMFGYGGPIASMHLGRRALVSSKTKESKKVYTLLLEREALLSSKGIWRTDGGIRDPSDSEIKMSPHGSFTKVEIREPKIKCLEVFQLQCRLKDIYFPYIQCDEVLSTGKTVMPIEFQVNDVDLAEIEGGEVAITNLRSCNGLEFVLQLRFLVKQETTTSKTPSSRELREANARLKCVYFPIIEGIENIDRILEKLEAEGCGLTEDFETFCRVSIRRLGRLLPDARWGRLPFMEPKQRKGDKAQVLKRCCWRVKCFVETDAGFSPTPSKTDLAHHDPFTIALKNFGHKSLGEEPETTVEIRKDGMPLNLSNLEKEYQDWLCKMHDGYDEEIVGGEDQPVLILRPSNKKALGISSDVVRVHQLIRRKGASWKSGQRVKILKGAERCHKNNIYATLEYILLEGFEGDAGGAARLICRPLGCSEDKGSLLTVNGESPTFDIRDSLSFPINVIDSGKCQPMDTAAWGYQLEKQRQKAPSSISVLNAHQCRQLEINGALPIETRIYAGYVPPNEIVAVVRPGCFTTSSPSEGLDQKYILKNDLEMKMEIIRFGKGKDCQDGAPICAERIKASSRKGLHGFYIFPLGSKFSMLFRNAGAYSFTFRVICPDSSCIKLEKQIIVEPSCEVGKWGLLCNEQGPFNDGKSLVVRVGSCAPHLSVACYDEYYNRIPFAGVPKLDIKINTKGIILIHIDKLMVGISSSKMSLEITDILVESSELDLIRPLYEATLEICSHDKLFSVSVPCKVIPGPLYRVRMIHCLNLQNCLVPGVLIKELRLELLDGCGNHVEEGIEVRLDVDGFRFQDHIGSKHKVDGQGYVNLGGLLEVTGGYNTSASISVYFGDKMFLKKDFQIAKRELRAVSGVPGYCVAGSQLENIVFEIIDSEGAVDEAINDDAIHGLFHTLTIISESSKIDTTIRYAFQHGRCTVPAIPVPHEQGNFCFMASHSHHPELRISFEVCIMQAPKLELVTVSEPDSDVVQSQCLDGRMLLLQDSSHCSTKHMHTLVDSHMNDWKNLEEAVAEVSQRIDDHESKLKMLNCQKEVIGQEIYDLQASMGHQSLGQFDCIMNAKEQIWKRIEGKGDIAASVFCNLLRAVQFQEPQKHLMKDVVGLVALLGTVDSKILSRMFAEYLGEDYMLAVVCKSSKNSSSLEKYSENGEINRSSALHGAAATLGKKINGRFLVICLEEIRPFSGGFKGNDPQRILALPDPLLPSRKLPPGYLGYAVNMINLDMHHLHTRTITGHGLRETLFYLLFGELQVYQTRAQMKQASSYIKSGAISLDGGIQRGNGVISLGHRETDILFPVVDPKVQRPLSQVSMDAFNMIEGKLAELEAVRQEIAKEEKAHDKTLQKFTKQQERLQRFVAEKVPLIKGFLLEDKPETKS